MPVAMIDVHRTTLLRFSLAANRLRKKVPRLVATKTIFSAPPFARCRILHRARLFSGRS